MIRNFFRVALRSFLRQKFYSFINIFGLTSGLVCTLFIYLWVSDELNRDRFHKDVDRIHQVVMNLQWDGSILTWTQTPGPLADEIRSSIPEVTNAVRTTSNETQLFQVDELSFRENGYFADPDFFKIFSFPIVEGNTINPVTDKSSVAISETLAKKLFGNESAIGKVVRVQKKYDQTVTAVFANTTAQSSLQFDFIIPFAVHEDGRTPNWSNSDYDLYVKLIEGADRATVLQKINAHLDNVEAGLAKASNEDANTDYINYYMQPFGDRYLNGTFENGVPVGGRIRYVNIFSVVALFILGIACINFMNMATARAANRSKEVGVRKVIGAQRKGLIVQFIAESVLLSAASMLVALGIIYTLLPLFNTIVAKQIVLPFTSGGFMLTVVGIVLLTGLLAGSYPALFLSSYNPVTVLKGSTLSGFSGAGLRRVLVVFQFTLTVVLITSALVIYTQIDYIRNKNLGYDRSAVLYFNGGAANRDFESFKHEALQLPAITQVSRANQVLVNVMNQNNSVSWPGKPDDSRIFFRTVTVDNGFLETMGIRIIDGRSFSKDFADTSSFVITQKAADVMGLKNPIGTKISQWGHEGTIVGIAEDFHSRSMHEAIDPIIFFFRPDWSSQIHVRFEAGKTQEVIKHLDGVYKKFNVGSPFQYAFLDDEFEKLYDNERVTSSLALGFTIMAVIISGLGLLGLAAYTAERKKKEIGIRKTLGASIQTIVAMMSKDFIQLSLIAAVIGCPLAYYFMQQFLSSYAYHMELGWGIFLITVGLVTGLTLLTVAFQVMRAAIANPVDALRNQ